MWIWLTPSTTLHRSSSEICSRDRHVVGCIFLLKRLSQGSDVTETKPWPTVQVAMNPFIASGHVDRHCLQSKGTMKWVFVAKIGISFTYRYSLSQQIVAFHLCLRICQLTLDRMDYPSLPQLVMRCTSKIGTNILSTEKYKFSVVVTRNTEENVMASNTIPHKNNCFLKRYIKKYRVDIN